ncbi:MAG: choice-of-anchor D domain-containing protein, partial [Candidatus Acidiferrales bacterium]
ATTTGTPALTISPSAATFGNVPVGQSSTQSMQLINNGNASLSISTASMTGTGFGMSGLTPPVTIGAGQSLSFSVQFAPTAAGSVSGSISITNNATGSPVGIPLTGTGTQAGISANPASASFGNVVVGANNSQPIMLTNTGNVALTISAANVSGTGFSITNAPTTIAAGQNASSTRSSHLPGNVKGSVSLTSNATGAPFVIPFSGTGMAATYLLGANPTTLGFGNITLNSNSSLAVTLTNNGNSNVTISGVAVTGSGFSTSGVTSGLTLQPSQTATLTVAFAPTAAGAAAGSVTVTSNASNSPTTISLTGSSYSVNLAWQSSSSSELAGYNVFRGTSSGSYTQLNTSLHQLQGRRTPIRLWWTTRRTIMLSRL